MFLLAIEHDIMGEFLIIYVHCEKKEAWICKWVMPLISVVVAEKETK